MFFKTKMFRNRIGCFKTKKGVLKQKKHSKTEKDVLNRFRALYMGELRKNMTSTGTITKKNWILWQK